VPGAGELRVLRRRIRSVKSTQKITRAMELIAASRIARARARVEEARPYAEAITQVMRDLATVNEVQESPVMRPADASGQPTGAAALVVITSDRGLAGAYNTNAIRRAERAIASYRDAGREVRLFMVGAKGESQFRYRGEEFQKVWTGISDRPGYADARDIAGELSDRYAAEEVASVDVVYTDFRSALTQVASVAQVLPVEIEDFAGGEEYPPAFDFEPDPVTLLENLIPRYVEAKIYAALLESAASEHASRQRAMKAATDNADDIIDNLTREANRARQAAITTEITEIVGGAEALASK
jgi:F-type H+-transporting ATPase subunit gamma